MRAASKQLLHLFWLDLLARPGIMPLRGLDGHDVRHGLWCGLLGLGLYARAILALEDFGKEGRHLCVSGGWIIFFFLGNFQAHGKSPGD